MSKIKRIIKKWLEKENKKTDLVGQCEAYRELQNAGIEIFEKTPSWRNY